MVLVLLLQSASLTASSGREPYIASKFCGGCFTPHKRINKKEKRIKKKIGNVVCRGGVCPPVSIASLFEGGGSTESRRKEFF